MNECNYRLFTVTGCWLVDLIFNIQVNNFSFMLGRNHHFLGITSTFGGKCALLKDTKRFDPSGARTTDLWIWSPGHNHQSTSLPSYRV